MILVTSMDQSTTHVFNEIPSPLLCSFFFRQAPGITLKKWNNHSFFRNGARQGGIFRDSFANVVELLDDALQRAAKLEEPLEMNFVRKHYLETRPLKETGWMLLLLLWWW